MKLFLFRNVVLKISPNADWCACLEGRRHLKKRHLKRTYLITENSVLKSWMKISLQSSSSKHIL